jgi:hypothetical protein
MLQAAIDLVGLSVYSWDLLAGTADRDDRIKAIWGLPPEAKVDLALACSAVHPDDVSGLDAVIARATDPQGDGHLSGGIEDGVERWVSSYGETTFMDGKGSQPNTQPPPPIAQAPSRSW